MFPRSLVRLRHQWRPLVAAALFLVGAAAPTAAAEPADCNHEQRLASGAPNPSGLCVSYGYGIQPEGYDGYAYRNVVAWTKTFDLLPFDYYVRSDVAQQIAAGTARPRATYLLFYGGAFMCGSRADVAYQAREMASRGYVVIAAEYPLAAGIPEYGYYRPNGAYQQASFTQRGANSCDGFDDWVQTPAWQQNYLPRFKAAGLEPALAEAQRTGQKLVRTLRQRPARYGVDPKRIFAFGWSSGGSVALRLALGGDDDRDPVTGVDPGDSTIAGAVSVSGPACYPGSTKVTAPMLGGQLRPSDAPACRFSASPSDPRILMLQEPRGGADDAFIPSELMLGGCAAINAVKTNQCVYEDRPASAGGYLSDGDHAYITAANFSRLLDALAAQGVGAP